MYRVAALASERGKADNENSNLLQRWRRQPKAHALGITRLIVVPQEHFVVSLSFDACVAAQFGAILRRNSSDGPRIHHRCRSARVFDTQSGASLLAIDNGRKARFSSLWWDSMHKQLVLGDTTGHVAIWDVASERQLVDEKLCDGEVREVSTAGSELLASSDDTCGVWRVLREVKYLEAKGHTGAVVALASSEPSAAGGGEPVLYSAGYDNTIQLWDPYDMQSVQVRRPRASASILWPHTRPTAAHA